MRIHRIGQKRTVCVRRFIVKHTVEERMQQVQARKQRMIAGALTDEEERVMVSARLLGMEPVLKFYPPKISNGSLNYHNLLKVETKLSQKVIVESIVTSKEDYNNSKMPKIISRTDGYKELVLYLLPRTISSFQFTKKTTNSGKQNVPGKKIRRGRSKDKQKWIVVDPPATNKSPQIDSAISPVPPELPVIPLEPKSPINPLVPQAVLTRTEIQLHSKLGTSQDTVRGESSGTALLPHRELLRCGSGASRGSQSDVQPDSSDVESSDSELEEGEF
ncbi:hypothetical protein DY000_02024288, partial [Brassica cretica]